MEKLIITCAVTGSGTLPAQTPYLPLTPEQIADDAVRAAEAGAACVHIHARDPKNGKPSAEIETYRKIITSIKARSNVVIGITTGGAVGFSREERIRVVREFKPELASCNMGSISLSTRGGAERLKEKGFKYDWEPKFLEMLDDDVQKNTFADLDMFINTMNENGTKPSHECYSVNHLYNLAYYYKRGIIKPPLWVEFVTGALGSIGANPEDIIYMKSTAERLIGVDNFRWSLIAVGYPTEIRMGAMAIAMGGHIRVGFEDNIFIKKGVLAKSNAELVEKMVKIAKELDREVATPDEARKILELKGKEKVNY